MLFILVGTIARQCDVETPPPAIVRRVYEHRGGADRAREVVVVVAHPGRPVLRANWIAGPQGGIAHPAERVEERPALEGVA